MKVSRESTNRCYILLLYYCGIKFIIYYCNENNDGKNNAAYYYTIVTKCQCIIEARTVCTTIASELLSYHITQQFKLIEFKNELISFIIHILIHVVRSKLLHFCTIINDYSMYYIILFYRFQVLLALIYVKNWTGKPL